MIQTVAPMEDEGHIFNNDSSFYIVPCCYFSVLSPGYVIFKYCVFATPYRQTVACMMLAEEGV
jgi:hypothetical protein